jgi:hypothetical protein
MITFLSVSLVFLLFLGIERFAFKDIQEDTQRWHEKEFVRKKIKRCRYGRYISAGIFIIALGWFLYWKIEGNYKIDWRALAIPLFGYGFFLTKEYTLNPLKDD